MPVLPNERLAGYIRRYTESTFFGDEAVYIAFTSGTQDSYGQPARTAKNYTIACSFSEQASAEDWKDYADVETNDSEIRFSLQSFTPNKGDRVKLTKRYGTAVTNVTFEIVGIRDRGAIGYVCALRDVNV